MICLGSVFKISRKEKKEYANLKISANSADLFCIMNPWNWWKVTFLTYLIKILIKG